LVIDEADTFARDNEEIRGILNSGHTRDTAWIIRCEGEENEPKPFSTWTPKAIASIGKLAATLRDRSIIIPMKRKKRNVRVSKLRAQDDQDFMTLRRKAARWGADNIEVLTDARPSLPEELNDRAADNWESLLAIADLAGGEWPNLARQAAIALSGDSEMEAESVRVMLLRNIRTVFETLDTERIPSEVLVAELVKDGTGPWGSYGRTGKPITQSQVAGLLAEHQIRPRGVRIGNRTPRGYLRESFLGAWEAYLPPSRGFSTATPQHPSNISDIDEKSPATSRTNVSDRLPDKPLEKTIVAVLQLEPPWAAIGCPIALSRARNAKSRWTARSSWSASTARPSGCTPGVRSLTLRRSTLRIRGRCHEQAASVALRLLGPSPIKVRRANDMAGLKAISDQHLAIVARPILETKHQSTKPNMIVEWGSPPFAVTCW
jgi:Protein of unknown function (DUF3631)